MADNIKEFEHVKIKKTGITGIVVDISERDGNKKYIIESDEKGVAGGWGEEDSWKLFDCEEDELEKIP